MKKYQLWYKKEAPTVNEDMYIIDRTRADENDGWERWSLPIGNGYMGVNVFGRTMTERCQITENSLANPYKSHKDFPCADYGVNNFCELMLDFNHPSSEVKNYRRGLRLDDAIAYVTYEYNNVEYSREYFTSYPDRIFAIKISASKGGSVSLSVRPQIAGVGEYTMHEGDGFSKSGSVEVTNNIATIAGVLGYYQVCYEGRIMVIPTGGDLTPCDGYIKVTGADSVVILVAVGTNYQLESRVFIEEDPKKKLAPYPLPHKMVCDLINSAQKKGYDDLKKRHINDYRALFERVDVDLGGIDTGLTTDELVTQYKNGVYSQYLEELYFQYGRYLLISSSRPGTYPATLQGTWNRYTSSPWSCGYWHNINVQMNYWPAFNTNLSECFKAYIQYHKEYKPQAKRLANEYIKQYFPDKYTLGDTNGWNIGTGGWLYKIEGNPAPLTSHSGPSTGAFTSDLFWEYYAFTGDKEYLREVGYPALYDLSVFLSKVLVEEDGKLLVKYSASPEQRQDGQYYYTRGCAFDQQMLYENYLNTIKAAEVLGITDDDFINKLKQDINRLDPVQIGKSGQIKEYREEEYYGDIGEKNHRHISHLVGLYPGTLINQNHKDWLEAAKLSLNMRGDESTGWSTAHKINAWARTKDGNRAYDLVRMILSKCTAYNLWDLHPPFQIDGNFGATAGIAEMLLQSHEGFIHVLPAIPSTWHTGSFTGLSARGGYEIGAKWANSKITQITILSKLGGECKLFVGDAFDGECVVDGYITINTMPNEFVELV